MKALITAIALTTLIPDSTFANGAPCSAQTDGSYKSTPWAEWHRQVSQYCVPENTNEPQIASHKIYRGQTG